MLALIAMEEPYNLTAELIRDEKIKVLEAIEPFDKDKLAKRLVKGQYEGYKKDVKGESETETFFALKTYINLPRWSGVPFYLRTGKRLSKKLTEKQPCFSERKLICLFLSNVCFLSTFKLLTFGG